MTSWITPTVLSLAMSFASVAAAAPLDRKQAGALKRIATDITNKETRLADYGPGARLGQISERVEGDLTRQIAGIEAKLASLPADNAEVKAELAHLAALKRALAAKVAARNQVTQAADAARAAREAIAMSPGFDADHASLRAMVDMFERARWYALDHYHFDRWVDHEDNVAMAAWGKGWAATQADFARLRATYAPLVDGPLLRAREAQRQLRMAEVVDHRAVAKFEAFRAAVAGFVQAAPGAVDADARELAGLVAKAAAALDLPAVLDPQGRIQTLRNRLANVSAAYAPLAEAADRARVVHAAQAAESQAAAAIAALTIAAIDARRAPADVYTGRERKALVGFVTQAWATQFPGDAILQVRIRATAFERTTAWVPDPSTGGQVKRDASRLPITVIVQGAAGEAYLYGAGIGRDHMAGDRLALDWVDRPAKGPAPTQRMRLANLDGGAR